MGWLLEFLGVVVGSAVIPITLAVNSAHASSRYMEIAAPIATICGLVSWLSSTKAMYGAVNVTTTFENWSMFIGCTVSLFVPLLIWLAMWPLHRTPYDWQRLFCMEALQPRPGDRVYDLEDTADLGKDWDPSGLARASRNAKIVSSVLCLVFLIVIPFSLYGTGYVFSRNFFLGWTVVVFIWSWAAALTIWCLPLWDSRVTIMAAVRRLTGRKTVINGQASEAEVQEIAEKPAPKAMA